MDMRKYAKKTRWEAAAMKMKKIVAFLVCLILAMSALGAFAEGDSATALNVAIGSQFTTLDPAMNTETVNAYVLQHIYAGMFVKDSDNNVVNLLCDTYEVSEDGLTYTFHMVEDAVWSDGVPVTAHDFEYAYLRALSYGPDNAYGVNNMVTYIAGAAEYNQRAMEAGGELRLHRRGSQRCRRRGAGRLHVSADAEHALRLSDRPDVHQLLAAGARGLRRAARLHVGL